MPIMTLKVMIMPKWTGSMPSVVIRGLMIGMVKTRMVDELRNIPNSRNMMFKSNRMSMGFSVMSRIKSVA